MSHELAPIDADAVIPDGVEPIIGYRSWEFLNGQLCSGSRNVSVLWPPGEPLVARCLREGEPTWRQGFTTRPTDPTYGPQDADYGPTGSVIGLPPMVTRPLTLQTKPPPGMHLNWIEETIPHHPAPAEGCSCGIYAVNNQALVPSYVSDPYAHVWGAVKLWGRIIPGEKGWRAEKAYPDRLYTASEDVLLALEGYGVPVSLSPCSIYGRAVPIKHRRGRGVPAPSVTYPVAGGTLHIPAGEHPLDRARRRMNRLAILNGAAAVANLGWLAWMILR